MGIADIIKKRQRKRKLDKEFLYGKWSKDMDEDDIGRSGYAPLAERTKEKTGSEGYRKMEGKDLAAEGKKTKKKKKKRVGRSMY